MKTNPALKVLAFLLCVLTGPLAFWGSVLSLIYWDQMWTEADYFSSSRYYSSVYDMDNRAEDLLGLLLLEQREDITYAQQERLSLLRQTLAPENTNYRFQLRMNATGELLASNTEDAELNQAISGVNLRVLTMREGMELAERDYVQWETIPLSEYAEYIDGDGGEYDDEYIEVCTLRVWTGEEYIPIRSDLSAPGFNEYGWYLGDSGQWDTYDSPRDCRVTSTEYALTSGVLSGLPVNDEFRAGRATYEEWHTNLPLVGAATLVNLAVFLLALTFLFFSAGHRKGTDAIARTWADRIPLDVLGAALLFLALLAVSLGDPIAYGLNLEIRVYRIVGLLAVSAVVTAAGLGFLLTTAVRIKSHNFLSSILTWRVCVWAWRTLGRMVRAVSRGVSEIFHTLSMNVRLTLGFLLYLFLNAFLAAGFFLNYDKWFYLIGLLAFNGGVLWLGCRWISQWRAIRESTRRIVGGDPTVQIDTHKMYSDLREHAGQLNDLGTAINHAVDERMKSEHFKSELITNVSHDLKTPLTSIINYVDLLKKADITDPKALEYLEVLDRKSQRLKKLTEDLVEASKASTGNVTVNADRIDLVEFTQQAAAEYEDRLLQQRLTLLSKMPDKPVYISADGRHMWRILDNLLGNCVKYAMEGTRVYLEVMEWDGKASISLKNISREALNLTPDELMERFIRGEKSRTTEGSGLGLSIARSLTEVQGGTFRLSTDGDLFKATVYFPLLLSLEENKPGC